MGQSQVIKVAIENVAERIKDSDADGVRRAVKLYGAALNTQHLLGKLKEFRGTTIADFCEALQFRNISVQGIRGARYRDDRLRHEFEK